MRKQWALKKFQLRFYRQSCYQNCCFLLQHRSYKILKSHVIDSLFSKEVDNNFSVTLFLHSCIFSTESMNIYGSSYYCDYTASWVSLFCTRRVVCQCSCVLLGWFIASFVHIKNKSTATVTLVGNLKPTLKSL